jgi:hypothetical protein
MAKAQLAFTVTNVEYLELLFFVIYSLNFSILITILILSNDCITSVMELNVNSFVINLKLKVYGLAMIDWPLAFNNFDLYYL